VQHSRVRRLTLGGGQSRLFRFQMFIMSNMHDSFPPLAFLSVVEGAIGVPSYSSYFSTALLRGGLQLVCGPGTVVHLGFLRAMVVVVHGVFYCLLLAASGGRSVAGAVPRSSIPGEPCNRLSFLTRDAVPRA
jgi:hypothetical protein